jgi:phosphatidate cytidylyltransferase
MLQKKFAPSNTLLRVISSVILCCIAYCCLKEGIIFLFCFFAIYIGMLVEWVQMACKVNNKNKILNCIIGIFLIGLSCLSGYNLFIKYYFCLIFSITLVIVTDTFAMLGGKLLQGPKLVPKISPSKTWSGLFIAILACIIFFELMNFYPKFFLNYIINLSNTADNVIDNIKCIIIISLFPLVSQASDILESHFKRKFGVKDSGKIILGHGGILDRFDGWLLTLPFTLLFTSILCKCFPALGTQ